MAEVDRGPVYDDCGEQVQPADPVMLTLGGVVTDFTLPNDAQRILESVVGFTLVEADLVRRRMSVSRIHSTIKSIRSTRPTSRSATARSFWRGCQASLRSNWLGLILPAAMVAAHRNRSCQR